VANTDNPETTRLENRLTRLGQARQTLDIVRMRLKQIERRAPQLRVIVEGAYDNLDEALTEINREFEETRRERWPAGKEEG
jgi:hypothetical protein